MVKPTSSNPLILHERQDVMNSNLDSISSSYSLLHHDYRDRLNQRLPLSLLKLLNPVTVKAGEPSSVHPLTSLRLPHLNHSQCLPSHHQHASNSNSYFTPDVSEMGDLDSDSHSSKGVTSSPLSTTSSAASSSNEGMFFFFDRHSLVLSLILGDVLGLRIPDSASESGIIPAQDEEQLESFAEIQPWRIHSQPFETNKLISPSVNEPDYDSRSKPVSKLNALMIRYVKEADFSALLFSISLSVPSKGFLRPAQNRESGDRE